MGKPTKQRTAPAPEGAPAGVYVKFGRHEHVFSRTRVIGRVGGDTVFIHMECDCGQKATVGMNLASAKVIAAGLAAAMAAMERAAELPLPTVVGVGHG
jgi:hypothetical protein